MTRIFASFQIMALAALFMLSTVGEGMAGIKIWPSTRDAGDAFFAEFVNGTEASAKQFLLTAFDGQADPDELVKTYRTWLGTTELHSIKLMSDDRLGEVLTRETYALQKITNGLLFVRLSFVVTPKGWALYYIQIETDIAEFYAGWRNPN